MSDEPTHAERVAIQEGMVRAMGAGKLLDDLRARADAADAALAVATAERDALLREKGGAPCSVCGVFRSEHETLSDTTDGPGYHPFEEATDGE